MIRRLLGVVALLAFLLGLALSPLVAIVTLGPIAAVAICGLRGNQGSLVNRVWFNTSYTILNASLRSHGTAGSTANYARSRRGVVGLFAPPEPRLLAVC